MRSRRFNVKSLYKCSECDTLIPLLDKDYHDGCEKNNMDESYRIECKYCNETYHWEPNYDGVDDIVKYNSNNIIALSQYFTISKKRKIKKDIIKITNNELDKLLSSSAYVIIENPPKGYGKKLMPEYLDNNCKDLPY